MPLSRELMRRPRLQMNLARRGMPGVNLLGRYNYTSARAELTEHLHRGAIEICFMVKGSQTYRVGQRDYRLSGGDVFITFPDEPHSSGGTPEEKGILYWITLQVSPSSGLLGLPPKQSRALLGALLKIRQHHFRGSWKMKDSLDAVTTLFHQPASPINALAMANELGAFLLQVLACAEGRPRLTAPSSLSRVLHYIEQHLDEPAPVSQLAALAGLSESHFKARFKTETGIPPGEYILRARVQEAQRRLAAGRDSVTRIAFDLGFSSSQYFATVFKRFTGQSPRQVKPSLAN